MSSRRIGMATGSSELNRTKALDSVLECLTLTVRQADARDAGGVLDGPTGAEAVRTPVPAEVRPRPAAVQGFSAPPASADAVRAPSPLLVA